MKHPVRVFVVDDHPIITAVLTDLLQQSEDFEVVGSADTGEEALARLATLPVDILLLDLLLPGISGLELLQRLPKGSAAPRTVIYTGSGTDDSIAAAFAHGVSAFLEKSASVEELLASLRAVVRGEFPLNSRLSGVLRTLVRQQQPRRELGALDLQVLRKLALHHSTKEIAHELGLSTSGVYKARTRITTRLGLAEHTDFRSAAANLGLLQSPPDFARAVSRETNPHRPSPQTP